MCRPTPTFTWNAVAGASYLQHPGGDRRRLHQHRRLGQRLGRHELERRIAEHQHDVLLARLGRPTPAASARYSSVLHLHHRGCARRLRPPAPRPTSSTETGFESGAGGWTSSGTGDTWAIAATNPHSGASHYPRQRPGHGLRPAAGLAGRGHPHRPEPGDAQVLARAEPRAQRHDRLLRRRHPGGLDRRRHDLDPGAQRQPAGRSLHGRGLRLLRQPAGRPAGLVRHDQPTSTRSPTSAPTPARRRSSACASARTPPSATPAGTWTT